MRSFWGVIWVFLMAFALQLTTPVHAACDTPFCKILKVGATTETPVLTMITGELVPVIWVAQPGRGEPYYFQRRDSGQYVRAEFLQVSAVHGKILKHIPDVPADSIERVTCAHATIDTLPDKTKMVRIWPDVSKR